MKELSRRAFSLVETLIAIAVMVIATSAILSAFLSSSHLRVFSESFTIGINACQKELERIRFRYESGSDQAPHLSFAEIISVYQTGAEFSVFGEDGSPNPNFKGVVTSVDPYAVIPAQQEMLVILTARVAFREGTRIVGGDSDLNPSTNTPCQLSMTIVNKD